MVINMAKKDDKNFWDSGQDSFWNTDSDDWLKQQMKSEAENPYSFNESAPQPAEVPVSQPASFTGEKESRVHIHTIICLAFLVIAFFSVIGVNVFLTAVKRSAREKAAQVSYEEEEAGRQFAFNENNQVFLEDRAYTLIEADTVTGLPEGKKLIALYVQIKSEEYIDGATAFKDFYLRTGEDEYKSVLYPEKIIPYLSALGSDIEKGLSVYGIGNGSDCAGFFFFFVPEETKKVTLYVEKHSEQTAVSYLEHVFYKDYEIWNLEDSREEIRNKEVYDW